MTRLCTQSAIPTASRLRPSGFVDGAPAAGDREQKT